VLRRSKILHPRVETRPGVCGGEPVVRGTRFPVRSVVEYHKDEIDRSIRANRRAARPTEETSSGATYERPRARPAAVRHADEAFAEDGRPKDEKRHAAVARLGDARAGGRQAPHV